MYVLEAPLGWDEFRVSARPPQKRDADGNLMFERYPRPTEPGKPVKSRESLLDFWILPDSIGTQEPWWYFEAVRRIDPRVRWTDITMRMPFEGRPSENSLNQDGVRHRPKYGMRSWFPKQVHRAHNARRDTAMAMLSAAQIAANTTRGTTPGLIAPELGEAGGRVPHPAGRKGHGVRHGPRKKASLEISVNEADDEESKSEGYGEEVAERENTDSWPESVQSKVKPSKIMTGQTKNEVTREWRWVEDVIYDGRGLGKSKPPGYKQPQETQAQIGGGKKRKADAVIESRTDPDLPPKKRILDWLPIEPRHTGSFQFRQDLSQVRSRRPFSQDVGLTSDHENTTVNEKPHHRYDWRSIEHAVPYDTNSYVSLTKFVF